MQKLTTRLVEPVAIPRQKQVILLDSELKGFGLRVTASGGKSYVVEARVNGKPKRLTVGLADLFSVDEAQEAICLLAQMTTGTDPQVEKERLAASLITFGAVLDHYLSMQRLKPSYKGNLHGWIHRYLGAWLTKPIASITAEMVQTRHGQIGEAGQTVANTAIKQYPTLVNYAINTLGVEMVNPVAVMYKNRH